MKAVILAAGHGTRLGPLRRDVPKVLIRVAGRELLWRHLRLLSELGVEEFIIVVNAEGRGPIEEFLRGSGFKYRLVLNEAPEKGNGYSLYLARDHVEAPFLVVMGDHVYGEEFLREAIKGKGLIIDRTGRFVDKEEATKVKDEGGRVEEIGKEIEGTAFDTGFFVLDTEIFHHAQEVLEEKGRAEMSEIVRRARLEVTEVSGLLWIDVDTPEDARRATRVLVRRAVKEVGDGAVSRLFNRRVSLWISERAVNRLTPNQASILSSAVGLLAAFVALVSPAAAGLIYQLSSILDGVDGEIARASLRNSSFGGWMDSLLDRGVDFLFLLALGYTLEANPTFWGIIAAAIFGTIMVSYSTERYKAAYLLDIYREIPAMRYLVGKRDERIFVTMCFCLGSKIAELFLLLAFWTNLRVLITVLLVWKKEKGKGS